MKKYTQTYDLLDRPFLLHYHNLAKHQPTQEQEDMRALQRIVMQREGIQEGLTYSYKRRTYHEDCVCSNGSMYIDQKNINTIDQMNVRNYEEPDAQYYCDEYGDNKVIPFVCQLPARNHKEQWIYGYRYSDWEGQTVFLDAYEGKTDAMRCAERRAEEHAQSCYEDWESHQEGQRQLERDEDIQKCQDELAALRKVLKEQVSIVRGLRRVKVNLDMFEPMTLGECINLDQHNSTMLNMLWHNRSILHKQLNELRNES